MQGPDSTPTTLLNFRVLVGRFVFPGTPSGCMRLASLYLLRFQTCEQHLCGSCPNTLEILPRVHQPACLATCPVEVTNYCAAHLQSCAESWKRMCGPCWCSLWSIRFKKKKKILTYILVGSALHSTPFLCCAM